MPDSIVIILSILACVLTANSWHIHFIVKDKGVGKKILLWFNAILFVFFFLRGLGYLLFQTDILNMETQRTYNQYVFLVIYTIPFLQQWIMRGRRGRNESDQRNADKKELNFRRKNNNKYKE